MTETPWSELEDESIDFLAPSTPPLTPAELDLIQVNDRSSSEAESDPSTSATATAHTWQPIDLVKLDDSPLEPPAISGLFYVGKRHVVSGEAEAGKSWLLLAAAADEINAGHGVVWIDTDDMGASATLERLRSLGVADELIRQRFAFIQPNEPLSPEAAGFVTGWLAAHNGRLVVFDAFNATLTRRGCSPSRTRLRSVARWCVAAKQSVVRCSARTTCVTAGSACSTTAGGRGRRSVSWSARKTWP